MLDNNVNGNKNGRTTNATVGVFVHLFMKYSLLNIRKRSEWKQ